MEQPTIFYAIVFALVLMGFDHPINVYLAWAYVVLRIVHSLIQATVNIVTIRFEVFALSSLCLIRLTMHAAIFLIHHGRSTRRARHGSTSGTGRPVSPTRACSRRPSAS